MPLAAGVYTGIWTNQSKGSILGSTLTVTPDSGLLVVAVLALFVSLAGSQSWGILYFFVHQFRTTRESKHGIHYQQQIVLRNTGVSLRTIWQLGKIAWAWRSHGFRSFRRSVGLILMGVLHLLLFTAAGIFVSRLARVDNEILVRGNNCGLWNASDLNLVTDFVELSDLTVYERTTADASRDHVRQCLGEYESSLECNIFKRQNVTFQTSTNSHCPFDATMCSGPGGFAAKFDTGFLDSREDLGFNSKQVDRVQYRKVMTCSPITSESYSTNGSAYYLGRGYNYTAEFYGVNNLMPSRIAEFGGIPNATYVHSDFKALELGYDAQIAYCSLPTRRVFASPPNEPSSACQT
jgi:hypothetical protein